MPNGIEGANPAMEGTHPAGGNGGPEAPPPVDTPPLAAEDLPDEETAEDEPRGIWGAIRRFAGNIRDRIARLFGRGREEAEEPAAGLGAEPDVVPGPEEAEAAETNRRHLLRNEYLDEGRTRAIDELARRQAIDRLAPQILEHGDRGRRGEVRRAAQQRANEMGGDPAANMEAAVREELQERMTQENPPNWLRPNRQERRAAEAQVPHRNFLRGGTALIGAMRPEVAAGAELALAYAEEAAEEDAEQDERGFARQLFAGGGPRDRREHRLDQEGREEVIIEAARNRARAMLEELRNAGDPAATAEYLRRNMPDLERATRQAYPDLQRQDGQERFMRNALDELLGNPFQHDDWRENVQIRLEAGDSLEEIIREAGLSGSEIGAAMLYALAHNEVGDEANPAVRDARMIQTLIDTIGGGRINDLAGLVGQLQEAGIITEAFAQELLDPNGTLITGEVQTELNRYLNGENGNNGQLANIIFINENNPAYTTFLAEAIREQRRGLGVRVFGRGPFNPELLRLMAAADLLLDIGTEDVEHHVGLQFNERGELVATLPNDRPYMHAALGRWINGYFGEPGINLGGLAGIGRGRDNGRNPEMAREIEEIMMRRQFGPDWRDRLAIGDRAYIGERQAARQVPREYRGMAEGGEHADTIAEMMRTLGITREQAVQIIQTSETNLFREFLRGSTRAFSRLLRGAAVGGALLALGAVSPPLAAIGGAALTIYGLYNAARAAIGLVAGPVTGAVGAFRSSRFGGRGGEHVQYMGNAPWRGEGEYFGEEGRRPQGVIGRMYHRMRYAARQLWDPSLTGGALGAGVGVGVAALAGPTSVIFQPLVAIGAHGVGLMRQRGARNALRERIAQLEEGGNVGENMRRILQEIAGEGGDLDAARAQLREELLGNVHRFRRAGRFWSSFGTGYMLGNSAGALFMRLTNTRSIFERIRDRFQQPPSSVEDRDQGGKVNDETPTGEDEDGGGGMEKVVDDGTGDGTGTPDVPGGPDLGEPEAILPEGTSVSEDGQWLIMPVTEETRILDQGKLGNQNNLVEFALTNAVGGESGASNGLVYTYLVNNRIPIPDATGFYRLLDLVQNGDQSIPDAVVHLQGQGVIQPAQTP